MYVNVQTILFYEKIVLKLVTLYLKFTYIWKSFVQHDFISTLKFVQDTTIYSQLAVGDTATVSLGDKVDQTTWCYTNQNL